LPIQVPSTAEITQINNGADPGELIPELAATRPRIDLRVAGIGVTTDDFAFGSGAASDSMLLTPGFAATYLGSDPLAFSGYYGVVVRLKPGTDLAAFRDEVEHLVPDESVAFQTFPAIRSQAHRSSRPYSVALAASALVVAVLVALVTMLSLSRLVLADQR